MQWRGTGGTREAEQQLAHHRTIGLLLPSLVLTSQVAAAQAVICVADWQTTSRPRNQAHNNTEPTNGGFGHS